MILSVNFPAKIGSNVVAKMFTTFSTASKVICHLDFALGAFLRNKSFTLSVLSRVI